MLSVMGSGQLKSLFTKLCEDYVQSRRGKDREDGIIFQV